MTYSRDASVAFVHCPKAAGWSVKRYMAEHLEGVVVPEAAGYYDAEDGERVSWSDKYGVTLDDDIPKGHVRLAEFEEYLGVEPEEFDLIIGVTRNPYEQQVSQYRYWRHMWSQGGRMPQHALASTHPFHIWVQKPRSDYHATYNYHDHRPPKPIEGHKGYRQTAGFYPFWFGLDGEIPDNVELVEIGDLNEQLPELLKPYANEELGEVPRENSYDYGEDWREFYTPEARGAVEAKFEWAFRRRLYERWRSPLSREAAAG